MTRMSDFVWNAKTPPRAVGSSRSIVLAIHHPPGRNADVIQTMQHKSGGINVNGSLFDQTGSTREAQRDALLNCFRQQYPMSFIPDVNSLSGFDGDLYTEATDGWSAANCSIAADATYYKIGTKSIAITGLGGSNETLSPPSLAINCNLRHTSALCFWLRVPAVTTANNITLRVRSSVSNYYSQIIDLDTYLGGWTANTWKECIVPLGSASSGWTSTGSPNWTLITSVRFSWAGAASDTVYIDGLCFAYGVRFNELSSFLETGGNSNRYDYDFSLIQYEG